MATKREHTCRRCGKRFQDRPGQVRIYCGLECAALARRKERPSCEVCGRLVARPTSRYCSPRCADVARRRNRPL